MDEKELIKQVCCGNSNAFRYLVNQYQRLVFHVAARVLNRQEDLEDVCQEVFVKIHQKLPEFRGDAKLSTWIASITYRISLNHATKNKRNNTQEELCNGLGNEQTINCLNPEIITEKKETRQKVRDLIEKLPAQYKTVLSLYHLEEMSYKEIVTITGIPEGTVKNYIFRARKMLKQLLMESDLMKAI